MIPARNLSTHMQEAIHRWSIAQKGKPISTDELFPALAAVAADAVTSTCDRELQARMLDVLLRAIIDACNLLNNQRHSGIDTQTA